MSEIEYYVADLETTGLRGSGPMHQEITEVSIIRYRDKLNLFKNVKCDYPERASLDALKITGKTLADLKNGIEQSEAVEIIEKFLNEDGKTPAHRCIVGHNIITFDKKFFHALFERNNKSFPANLWLDTIALTKEFAKLNSIQTKKFNLTASCDMVGIKKFAGQHAAVADSRNTYLLFKTLMENPNINYLPLIKTFPHIIEEEDMSDLLKELED